MHFRRNGSSSFSVLIQPLLTYTNLLPVLSMIPKPVMRKPGSMPRIRIFYLLYENGSKNENLHANSFLVYIGEFPVEAEYVKHF